MLFPWSLLRRTRRHGDVERALGWLSAFALAAVATLFVILVIEDRRDLVITAEKQAAEHALMLSEHAARLLEGAELALSTVSDELRNKPDLTARGARRLHLRFRRLADRLPYIEAFWINGPSGRLRLSSLAFPTPPSDASGKGFFIIHRERTQSGVYVSAPLPASPGHDTFRVSRRLSDTSGNFAGVASATVEISFFRNFYNRLPLPPNSVITVRRAGDLMLLIRQPPDQIEPGPSLAPALAEQIAEHPASGLFQAQVLDGGKGSIVAYRMVPGFPLYVTVRLPLTAIHDAWIHQIWLRLGEAAAVIATLALLTWLGLRQARRQADFQEILKERVSERTRELEQTNAMLEDIIQEVHHRVRNNLQTVASLLNLQAAEVTEPVVARALAESIGRVHAIGLVHQILYDSGAVSLLPFGHYLRRLTTEITDILPGGHIPIYVHGEDLPLPLDRAVPLALIVHEILSNALQHAFDQHKPGCIRITLRGDDEEWTLKINDDGIGLPDDFHWDTNTGLGLRIVRSLAEQIGASAHLENDGGTQFTLKWPAAGRDRNCDTT